MKDNFIACFMFIVEQEGSIYEDDPDDPGGATKYGICKRDYPEIDIENLTLETAREIYRRDYWNVCNCDTISDGFDLLVFDTAVNQGTSLAKRIFEEADSIAEYTIIRIEEYTKLKKLFPKYGRGWISRAIRTYKRAGGF
jgi:lysozyme family protein